MGANIPPTRAVLLEARRSLGVARQGYDLLDRKRQVLINHAVAMLDRVQDVEQKLEEQSRAANEALSRARMSMGVEHVEWAALSTAQDAQVNITERSIMGVVVPNVRAEQREFQLTYGLGGTTASMDRATHEFGVLFSLVCRAAELRITASRLAREIKRTQRRVNALKNILIPRYETIVIQVESALEEMEREDMFRTKAIQGAQLDRR